MHELLSFYVVHLPAVEDRSIDCVDYNFQVGIISDEISERGTI